MMAGMHILIVDDEALARLRLKTLLADASTQGHGPYRIAEAADATEAMHLLHNPGEHPFTLLLLDICMPGQGGLELARTLPALQVPPSVVFITAHANHALEAFELDAVDYLTKPVRLERLVQALSKAERSVAQQSTPAQDAGAALLIPDRGATVRLPMSEVLYLKAEQKYLTVRTLTRQYLLDASLSELEQRFGDHLLRVHRNALAARTALRSLERSADSPADVETWTLRLHGVPEVLAVSRRQLPQVRAVLRGDS